MTQKEALEILRMGYSVYLTGEAGTGKTHLINRYLQFLHSKNVPVGITATTGIASTHIGGVTIDSWSGIGIKEKISEEDLQVLRDKRHLRERIQNAKVLIIDEVSMMSGVKLEMLDLVLQGIRESLEPFGGIQLILCGDFFQLPPVAGGRGRAPYAFESVSWKRLNPMICYLDRPYRQNDPRLMSVLRAIRYRTISEEQVELLRSRWQVKPDDRIRPALLYTHNVDVDRINREELDKIRGEVHRYMMVRIGVEAVTRMLASNCLAPDILELKKGALVMFVRNNPKEGYVNGTMGIIDGFDRDDRPIVKTRSGHKITAVPARWSIEETGKIVAEIQQIPLRLAWAITVHKSQGMTLDCAEIDLSKSFVVGMGYVALSRIRSLDGLFLIGMNEMAFQVDDMVAEFDKTLREQSKQAVEELRKMGWIRRFFRKFNFTYKLTSR